MAEQMDTLLSIMNRFRTLNIFSMLPLTRHEYMVMITIRCMQKKQAEKLTISAVAHNMEVVSPAVSRTLRGLEQQGLIQREVSQEDRRNTYVELTEKGMEALAQADQQMCIFHQGVLMRVEPEEVQQLIALLQKIYGASAEQLEQMKKGAERHD